MKNPLKIPLDALHLQRTVLERCKSIPSPDKAGTISSKVNFKQYYRERTEVIPALVILL